MKGCLFLWDICVVCVCELTNDEMTDHLMSLIDWLIDWLIDQSSLLHCYSPDWLPMIDWLIRWLVGWLITLLFDPLIDIDAHWLIDWLIYWLIIHIPKLQMQMKGCLFPWDICVWPKQMMRWLISSCLWLIDWFTNWLIDLFTYHSCECKQKNVYL